MRQSQSGNTPTSDVTMTVHVSPVWSTDRLTGGHFETGGSESLEGVDPRKVCPTACHNGPITLNRGALSPWTYEHGPRGPEKETGDT